MKFKSLTIWTIVLSFVIPIGIGHGVLCLGLIEIFSPLAIIVNKIKFEGEDISFSLNAVSEKSLFVAGTFALIGHILLILSLTIRRYKAVFWMKISGLLFLWVSFLYLTHNISNDASSQLDFFTGLPFLIFSIVLASKVIKEKLRGSVIGTD